MSFERTTRATLSRTLFLSLVPLAMACGGPQHAAPVEPASPAPSPAPSSPPPPAPIAGVYTGTQQTTVRLAAPAPTRGRPAASPQPATADAAGHIEVAEEAGAARFTIIDPSGGAPCALAATGTRPNLAITGGQTCTDARGTATVTLHIQEGTAVFADEALTLDFHGTMEMQQRRGTRNETRSGEVNYHFAGNREAAAQGASPASPAPGASATP